MYRTKSEHFYKPNQDYERTRGFWKIYRKIKLFIKTIYDISSVLVILMSFDKILKYKSFKVVKFWQIAQLVERIPRLFSNLQYNFGGGFH